MPEPAMRQAMTARTHRDVFFSIGTSTVVYPPEALRSGATVVEINPQPTPSPSTEFAIRPSNSRIKTIALAFQVLVLVIANLIIFTERFENKNQPAHSRRRG